MADFTCLPRMVWTHCIAVYLWPRDFLQLRLLNRDTGKYVRGLLPDVIVAIDLLAQNIPRTLPEEVRLKGEEYERLCESRREYITKTSDSLPEELRALTDPPPIIVNSLQILASLYLEESTEFTWPELHKFIRTMDFERYLAKYFISKKARKVPPNPNYEADWFTEETTQKISPLCVDLVRMSKTYLALQEYWTSPVLEQWNEGKKIVKELMKGKEVYGRVIQGISKTELKKRQAAYKRGGAKHLAPKKSGKKTGKNK